MKALRMKWFQPSMSCLDVIWHTNCDILEEYYRQCGTCNCPKECICVLPDGNEVKIGAWLLGQMSRKRRGRDNPTLTKPREARIQALVDAGKLRWNPPVKHFEFLYYIFGFYFVR